MQTDDGFPTRAGSSAELMEALMDAIPLPLVGIDRDLKITLWNRAAERTFGWTASEVLGKPNPTIPEDQRTAYDARARSVITGARLVSGVQTRVRRDGGHLEMLIWTAPHSAPGSSTAALAVYVDLSEFPLAEARLLRQRTEVAAFAQEALQLNDGKALREAAIQHLTAALDAQRVDILSSHDIRSPDANAIHAIALRLNEPVHRQLEQGDFDALPYLAEEQLRFGGAVPVTIHGDRSVIAAYTRDRPLHSDDQFALQAGGAILAAVVGRLAAETELARREATLRSILEQLPAIVWTADTQLILREVAGAGLSQIPEELGFHAGRSFFDVLRPTDDEARSAMRRALNGHNARYTYEFTGRIFDVSVQPLRDDDRRIRGLVATAFDVTDRERAEHDLRASREELRQLSARMHALEEEQRKRIAREIHDELGQRLTALSLELDLLRRQVADADALERISSMARLLRETTDTVRRVAADLRPTVLDDFGFRAAVENELAMLARRTGIDYELVLPNEEPPLGNDSTTVLFRIVQEALTNVARHSGASTVRVAVTVKFNTVHLEVSDDGLGITPEQATGAGSLGLTGIRERAYALGGEVTIERAEGGTRVAVVLPSGRK